RGGAARVARRDPPNPAARRPADRDDDRAGARRRVPGPHDQGPRAPRRVGLPLRQRRQLVVQRARRVPLPPLPPSPLGHAVHAAPPRALRVRRLPGPQRLGAAVGPGASIFRGVTTIGRLRTVTPPSRATRVTVSSCRPGGTSGTSKP